MKHFNPFIYFLLVVLVITFALTPVSADDVKVRLDIAAGVQGFTSMVNVVGPYLSLTPIIFWLTPEKNLHQFYGNLELRANPFDSKFAVNGHNLGKVERKLDFAAEAGYSFLKTITGSHWAFLFGGMYAREYSSINGKFIEQPFNQHILLNEIYPSLGVRYGLKSAAFTLNVVGSYGLGVVESEVNIWTAEGKLEEFSTDYDITRSSAEANLNLSFQITRWMGLEFIPGFQYVRNSNVDDPTLNYDERLLLLGYGIELFEKFAIVGDIQYNNDTYEKEWVSGVRIPFGLKK